MNIHCIIPLRYGSKSIPQKNIKVIAGKPLAQWVIDEANKSKYINTIHIAIDDKKIGDSLDAKVFWRSKESATDTAPSSMVLQEFCENLPKDDIIVLIQATSPLITHNEIDQGILKVLTTHDSCTSVVRQHRFIWEGENISPYDQKNRKRRQDIDNGVLIENGGFYITRVGNFLNTQSILNGKIGLIECNELTYHEVDEPSDWVVVEALLKFKHNV